MLYTLEPFAFITQYCHVTLALRCNNPLSALRALFHLFHRKLGLLGPQGPYLFGSTPTELGLMEFYFKQYGPFLHRRTLLFWVAPALHYLYRFCLYFSHPLPDIRMTANLLSQSRPLMHTEKTPVASPFSQAQSPILSKSTLITASSFVSYPRIEFC